jgi:hypothetical protein
LGYPAGRVLDTFIVDATMRHEFDLDQGM